jgi:cell division protein FtsZ
MEDGTILILGVGGIGCGWSERAHHRCSELADLLLIDADESSFSSAQEAHCLHLDATGDGKGTAALPNLAAHRLKDGLGNITHLLERSELVVFLTALGGGTGSGATAELAARARETGSLVLSVVGLPFAEQPLRCAIAERALPGIERNSHLCIRVSLERLAWQARHRNSDWKLGSEWIGELIEGLVTTLAKVGKMNLDLMDLRTVIDRPGNATLIVGTGSSDDPTGVVGMARNSPLSEIDVEGAKGCLIQIEGGPDMTLAHLNLISEAFVSSLDEDCQVILGARASDDMMGRLRLVAVVSGL